MKGWEFVFIALAAALISQFFIMLNTGYSDFNTDALETNCAHYGDSCVYYCNMTPGCAGDFKYNFPGVWITYPIALLGYSQYVLTALFLTLFVPAALLFMRTKHVVFSLSWMFVSIALFMGGGLYSQAIVSCVLMFLLLFDEGWKIGVLPRGILYGFIFLTHKLGWIVVLFLFIVESGFMKGVLNSRAVTSISPFALAILLLFVMVWLPGPFVEVEAIPSSLYMMWVSLPLMALSVHGQENELRNAAILYYVCIFIFALSVHVLHLGDENIAPYLDYTRSVGMVDLFALAFIARGKHSRETLTYVAAFLALSFFYRWIISPFPQDIWRFRVI